MKKIYIVSMVLALSFLLCFGSMGVCANDARVKEVREHIGKFKNEKITIAGFINRFEESDARSTHFYRLRDDWGDAITVRTESGLPEVGKRFSVQGVVTITTSLPKRRAVQGVVPVDEDTIFIAESSRSEIMQGPTEEEIKKKLVSGPLSSAEAALKAGNFPEAIQYGNQVLSLDSVNQRAKQINSIAQQNIDEQNNKIKKMWVLISVAGVIFLILLGVLIFVLMRRYKTKDEIVSETIMPDFVEEGKTVVMKRPPEGTMKLIPGKFVVLKGDDLMKEIRFQLPNDMTTKEFTFGRQEIPDQNPYGHVQLKAKTVSRIQAKLIYTDKGFMLINNSTVNPTAINGRSLKENESVNLNDGDVISMGEVEFKYEKQ